MPSRKIILIAIGSHGDVHPMVGIGKTLLSRGHRVTVIANEHFHSLIESVGLGFASIGTHEQFMEIARDKDLWHPKKGSFRVFQLVMEGLKITYDALIAQLEPGNTIVAGTSLSFAARIAQDKYHFPMATVHLAPICLRSAIHTCRFAGMPNLSFLPPWMLRLIWRAVDRFMIDPRLAPGINQLRASLGLEPVRRIMHQWWNSPDMVIGTFGDWFAPPPPDWPAQVVLTDFPRYDEQGLHTLSPELMAFIHAGSPPIAFTPGSAMLDNRPWFEAAIAACQSLGQRAILLTRHIDQIPANLPPTIRHEAYVPFSELLPHCAAVVHHGGIGSTAQGLAAGVPQLVIALAHDQFDNGHRLQSLGLGRMIPGAKLTAQRLATELQQLPPLSAHCRLIADQLSQVNGLANAANAIESLQNRL